MNRKARIAFFSSFLAVSLVCAGCTSDTGGDDDNDDVACESDADCRGDRICERGECVDPGDPGPPPDGTGGSDPGPGPESQDATLVVANDSALTVYYLYVSPCWASEWGPDLLGNSVLLDGQSIRFTEVPPDCYDLKAKGEYDVEWTEMGMHLNAGQTHTVTLVL